MLILHCFLVNNNITLLYFTWNWRTCKEQDDSRASGSSASGDQVVAAQGDSVTARPGETIDVTETEYINTKYDFK